MTFYRIGICALLAAGACFSALGAAGDAGNPILDAAKPHGDRVDRAWKRYRNPHLGYCVSYPSRWIKGDAFEGFGLFVHTGVHRYSEATGEIDVGPLDLPGPEDARLKPANLTGDSLEQNLQDHLAGMQKFARVERVHTVAHQRLKVQGFSALYAKNSYYVPLERSSWIEEVVFVSRQGQVYRLELQCPPNQLERFEPVFAYLVSTFEFDCN